MIDIPIRAALEAVVFAAKVAVTLNWPLLEIVAASIATGTASGYEIRHS